MAVLNKIRQRSLFLILVIALALFSFVLADLFRNSDALTNKSQNVIASVNGEDITREDFMLKVEAMQRQMGPNSTNTQAMNRAWDLELRDALMSEQYDKLGIQVGKDQMRDLLRTALQNNANFQNQDGVYDEVKLNEYIADLQVTSPQAYRQWVDYENSLATNAKQQAYYNMIKAGINGTIAEGEFDYKLENDKVDIKFVQIPYTSIADSTITVSDAEITAYVNKNPKDFEVEASRDINYVEFTEEPSLEDENNVKASLLKLLEDQIIDNKNTKPNDTIIGFRNTANVEDFVNANSAIKFNDRFLYKDKMPKNLADSIYTKAKGVVYGPYKQDQYYLLSKIVEEKQMPDSVKVRHILIPYLGAQSADATVTATKEAAKKTADSTLAIVKRNKSRFPALVTALSSDKGSIEKGGVYDYQPAGTMVPAFNDFEFEGKTGDLGVVETAFGFHIIEVLGQKNMQRVVKIASLALEIEASEKTINNVFNEVSKYEIAVNDGDFQAIAKDKNYTVKPVNTIKALDENIPGIGNQRQIVRWAFEEDTNVGDIKRFNLANGGYVVVQLSGESKKGLMTAKQASIKALPAIRKEKKAQIIKDRISASSVDDIAKAEKKTVRTANGITMKSPTISGAGREPKIVGMAFGMAEGTTSGVVDGDRGVYVIEVVKKTPVPGEANSFQAAANRLATSKAGSAVSKVYNALKEAADVEDNRAIHF